MRTRLLIIIGIVAVFVVFGILLYLFAYNENPAFPSGYPSIPQNDMYCWTQWYLQNTALDEGKLISSLRSTISEFGPDFDIYGREISVDHSNKETIITIGGSWTKDITHHKKLTSVIIDHIGDSELIRDDIVLCT